MSSRRSTEEKKPARRPRHPTFYRISHARVDALIHLCHQIGVSVDMVCGSGPVTFKGPHRVINLHNLSMYSGARSKEVIYAWIHEISHYFMATAEEKVQDDYGLDDSHEDGDFIEAKAQMMDDLMAQRLLMRVERKNVNLPAKEEVKRARTWWKDGGSTLVTFFLDQLRFPDWRKGFDR